jgi:hypothetical protein
MPKSFIDPMPEVYATFTDGDERKLFSYYPDEISFSLPNSSASPSVRPVFCGTDGMLPTSEAD